MDERTALRNLDERPVPRGSAPELPAVRTLMDAAPYSVGEDESLLLAWEVMERSRQRHLPVVRPDGCCAGLVDRAELALACAGAATEVSRRRVWELVHARRTCTVHPDDSTRHAAAVMKQEQLDALPVTDPHGLLVGLLTAGDYVAFAAGLPRRPRPLPGQPARAFLPGLPPRGVTREHGIDIP
ncbi:HPP family protein [Streptomyces sp. NPDC127190]|uniref:CBS domain-containing protein n=1 Tax=unclassified Streptomyces TaxID=2593676 RepID=UPI00362968C9